MLCIGRGVAKLRKKEEVRKLMLVSHCCPDAARLILLVYLDFGMIEV